MSGVRAKSFVCPVTRVPLVVNCELRECQYFVPAKWARGCLLAYVDGQGSEVLTSEEISVLYQLPLTDVNRRSQSGMAVLRQKVMMAESASDSDLRRQFEFVLTDQLCCVCGSMVVPGEGIPVEQSAPLAYCSEECLKEKHPLMIRLEHRYGIHIEVILKWALRKFRTPTLLEKALDLPRVLIQELCQQFFKQDVRESIQSIRKASQT